MMAWKEKCTCTVDSIVLLQKLLAYFLPCTTAAAAVVLLALATAAHVQEHRIWQSSGSECVAASADAFSAACQTPVCSSPPALCSGVLVLIWPRWEVWVDLNLWLRVLAGVSQTSSWMFIQQLKPVRNWNIILLCIQSVVMLSLISSQIQFLLNGTGNVLLTNLDDCISLSSHT